MKASIEEKLQRLMPLIPTEPQADAGEILERRGLLKGEILVYNVEKKNKTVRAVCSACGGESYLDYVPGPQCGYGYYGFLEPASKSAVTHGNSCICPLCYAQATAVVRSSFKSWYKINNHHCLTVHNVDGHLVVLDWIVSKIFRNSNNKVEYFARGFEGVTVIEKQLVRIKKYYKFMSSYSWISNWEYTKTYTDMMGRFSRNECIGIRAEIVDKTDCFASALSKYMKDGCGECADVNSPGAAPSSYLKLWLKHPNVENLIRQGYSKLISEIIEKGMTYRYYYSDPNLKVSSSDQYINWKENKPSRMLGLNKCEMNILKGASLKAISFYKLCKEKGIRLNREQLQTAQICNLHDLGNLIENEIHKVKIPIIHLLNYLKKQRDSEVIDKTLISVNYINDYWEAVYKVYGCLEPSLMWPKRLRRAHDEMIQRVEEKEDPKINAAIKARIPSLLELAYSDEETGLTILPAASQSELIKEGKILVHCVARYAAKHGKGETTIFFIRRIKEPDLPFFTLELSNSGTVIQNRGYKNRDRTKEVTLFEKKWLQHIHNLKENNNGKHLNERSFECAGT